MTPAASLDRGSATVRQAPSVPQAATVRQAASVRPRPPLRDSLLDAARRLLAQRPWARISMADVAREAGVSRQTLYAQFGSRDAFAQAFVIREGARFLDQVQEAILAHLDDPARAVRAGFELFLSSAAEDPLVRLLLSDDGTGEMLPLVTTRSRPLLEWAGRRLVEAIQHGWPDADTNDVELLSDAFVRLALSYVTLPDASPRASADAAATLLGPFVERALSGGGAGAGSR